MPRLDTYQSQGQLPKSTGQGDIPLAFGTQEPIIQGSARLAGALDSLVSIEAYKERRQQVAEQTTAGAEILMEVYQKTSDFSTSLMDPDSYLSGLHPELKKRALASEVEKYTTEANKRAKEAGIYAEKYVATHLRTTLDPQLRAFGSHMDVLRRENGQFRVIEAIRADRQDPATIALPDADAADRVARWFQDITLAKAAGFLTAEQAAALQRETAEHYQYDREVGYATANPEVWLDQFAKGNYPDIPRPVGEKIAEQVRHALAFKQSILDRTRQEHERVEKDTHERNLLTGMQLITNGTINSVEMLDQFAFGPTDQPEKGNSLNAAGYHTLGIILHNKTENIHSSPEILAEFYTRLNKPDERQWPSEGQIAHTMDPTSGNPMLSSSDGVALFNHLRAQRQGKLQRAETFYDKVYTQAEQAIERAFDPFIGGLLDYDKTAGTMKARALQDFSDKWYQNRNKPDQNPLAWVDELMHPYFIQLARLGKVQWEASDIRHALPEGTDTVDKVIKANARGFVDEKTMMKSLQWLKMLGELEVIAYDLEKKAQRALPDTPGVQRNR